MESNFNNREFEHYVKSNADQYRMIPSEKVWKGINNTLHTRRRWYGFGLSLLLLLTAVSVTWVMISYPNGKKQDINAVSNNQIASTQTANPKQSPATTSRNSSNILSFNRYSKESNTTVTVADVLFTDPTTNNTDITGSESLQTAEIIVNDPDISRTDKLPVILSDKREIVIPVTDNLISMPGLPADMEPNKNILQTNSFPLPDKKLVQGNTVLSPPTIESVTNPYQVRKAIKKLKWQVYFTPTVSYRKLSVNKSYNGNVSPFSASNYPFANSRDVNSEVVHKPDMGLELGVSTGYPISKNLRLIGGFQFNINRYDIKAFAYYGEQATINLNGGNGTNSVTAWTYYRNYSGYKSDWLKNYYFSVSAPVGAELKLFGNTKTYLGVSGTVQPTYILKDRAFLISTDYKNYVEMPRLIRRVNINTSLETFISYTSRSTKIRWQVGPQVRYQVLSSFKNPYPVKENLFDFGLKVGISRNK